jgi:uncharacterized membrane protein
VTRDYPTEVVRGESRSLLVNVGNDEHRTMEYTQVGKLQRVEVRQPGNDSVNDTTDAILSRYRYSNRRRSRASISITTKPGPVSTTSRPRIRARTSD